MLFISGCCQLWLQAYFLGHPELIGVRVGGKFNHSLPELIISHFPQFHSRDFGACDFLCMGTSSTTWAVVQFHSCNISSHLPLFPTVVNFFKIMSNALHVGGFPFSTFSSSFTISSTYIRILCFKNAGLRLGPSITLTLEVSVPPEFDCSALPAMVTYWPLGLWERGEIVTAYHS